MAYTSTSFEQPENRVTDALKLYTEGEAQLTIANPIASKNDQDTATLKLNYYSGILKKFRPDATPDEKLSLKYVEHQIKNIKAKLNPTPFNKILYSKAGNAIRNFVSGFNLLFNKQDNILTDIHTGIVSNYNVTNLQSSFAQKGFTINMESQLERMIQLNLPEFHLNYLDLKNNHTLYQLHCKKIPDTNLYYFEKFDAIANPTLDELRSGKVNRQEKQTFDATAAKGINASEAARLTHGKHIIQDNKCTYLDTGIPGRSQPVTTDINIDAELSKMKFPQLPADDYRKMKAALSKGDSYQVQLPIPGKGDTACSVELNPRNTNHKITVTDLSGNFINMNRFRKENIQAIKEIANTITGSTFSNDLPGFDFAPPSSGQKNKNKRA